MATSIWKGHLTFGLVSIPVKLYRAARAGKVGFRQVHEASGTRVRQTLYREPEPALDTLSPDEDGQEPGTPLVRQPRAVIPFCSPTRAVEVRRDELARGYEYEPGRYLVLSRAEMESITPATAHEMQILEFVQLAEVDPVYFETSYYAAPDRGGERAYGLLLAALQTSGLVGIAQVAMHRREHVVVIRSGKTGIVLHTMFYEPEVRRENEYRADTSQIARKELDLALLLVNSLTAPFDASKYRDGYREKLDALIAAKLAAKVAAQRQAPRLAPVVNIMDALQRSLEAMTRKPAAPEIPGSKQRRTSQRSATPQRGDHGGKVVRRTPRPSVSEGVVAHTNASIGSSSLATE
ncbi:MAG TPA: Ku protein [Gemmatimonadales bacterium]|nr:Ku protein [Gemmatimonadales bacterium]